MFIGETTRGIAQPVLYDTHTQIFNNKPPMTLVTGAPGSGKDLDINTPIPTPYGFVTMGDLRVGDKVLDRQSRPCRVTFAGDIKKRSTYEVKFSDGRTLIAGAQHQWSITTDSVESFSDDKINHIRKRKSDVLRYNVEALRSLQKNVQIMFRGKEWVTPQEITHVLKKTGVFFYAYTQSVRHILKTYAVLSTTMNVGKNNKPAKVYNVYMAVQACVEQAKEQELNFLYGDQVVTTQQLSKMPTGTAKIRTCVPKNNADKVDTGFLTENDVNVGTSDLFPLLASMNEDKDYGTIKNRRRELKELIETVYLESHNKDNVSKEEVINTLSARKGMSTLASNDGKNIRRINFLAHSLGCVSFMSDGEDKVVLEVNRAFDTEDDSAHFVHIVSVEKVEDRETRCISVDSPDHVYLAGEGFIPTHNTFFAMTVTCLSAVLGKTTVVLDPKGDFLSLAELHGDIGDVSFWALKDPKKAGILDPFYMAKSDGEKLSLVLETLSLFLGGLTNDQLQVLSPVIKDTIESDVPSLLQLKENLEMSPDRLARSIGAQLDIISKLPFANLCFSPGMKRQKEISIEEGVTVVTMAGLELSPDAGAANSSNKARLSSAVFFLITDFIRRFMHNSNDTTPKTVIIDEAWAVLATAEGARVIKEIALLARSKNLALVLITQNTSHLENIDVENTISTRFAFRTDAKEGKTIIENMGLPPEEGFENVLTSLSQGECLMQDWQQRYCTVQISQYNKRWKAAFETNPMEKLKKKKAMQKKRAQEKAARQRKAHRR